MSAPIDVSRAEAVLARKVLFLAQGLHRFLSGQDAAPPFPARMMANPVWARMMRETLADIERYERGQR